MENMAGYVATCREPDTAHRLHSLDQFLQHFDAQSLAGNEGMEADIEITTRTILLEEGIPPHLQYAI